VALDGELMQPRTIFVVKPKNKNLFSSFFFSQTPEIAVEGFSFPPLRSVAVTARMATAANLFFFSSFL
jgi:hypothetical protein